jgi:uncharacterized protein YjbI with pentapeptide repeats
MSCFGCESASQERSNREFTSGLEADQGGSHETAVDASMGIDISLVDISYIDAELEDRLDLSILDLEVSDAVFSDAVFSDAVFSDAVFSDAVFSDAVFSDAVFSDMTTSNTRDDLFTDAVMIEVDQSLEPSSPRSLVIALDGVRPDALAYADTPHLDALIAGTWHPEYQGAYAPFAQNLYDAATVSGPNHVSIMTGANGQQHQVSSNGDVDSGDYDHFPHYLARLEAAQPETATAYLFTWSTDAEIPSGADYIKDGDDADNVERVVAMLNGTHADSTGDESTSWPLGTQPHAIFLFLDDPDHTGHTWGFEPNIASYVEELASIDTQIGTILEALVNRPTWDQENWQIVITSDHGGYHTGHGGMSAPEHTIPFIVVSRSVTQGQLPPSTRNLDVAPTVLEHLGLPIPPELTGHPRGADAQQSDLLALDHDLVGYYRFEGDLTDATNRGNDGALGMYSDLEPTLLSEGGKFGGYLSILDIGGGERSSSYVTLGRPTDYEFGAHDSFTVSLWFRSHGEQSGDPVIIGNKNWVSGSNLGWLLLANEGADNSFGANYAGEGRRLDLEDIDYTDTDWWFLATAFDPEGVAVVFCGDSTGHLRWMALDATGLGALTSQLPLQIGQDGTGSYPHNLDADVDDLGIWRRALSFAEIQALYQQGRGRELVTLLPE